MTDIPEDDSERGPPAWRRFPALLAGLRRAGLDALYPPICLHCSQAVSAPHALCPACWRGLGFITRPCCERLGAPFAADPGAATVSPAAIADPPPWGRARAAVRYEGVARDLVHAMKFGDRSDIAHLLGRMMAAAGGELLAEADLVTPTPLHRTRLWSRRFNQAAALAAAVSRHGGPPAAPDLLRRVRRTAPQVGLTRTARASNLRGAFAAAPGAGAVVAGRRVLLVDDVMTSGATAAAATRALLKAGAAQVDVLTFALVVRAG
ncbi:ComF family protein [Camelimonas sp. ID_303_24]